MLCYFICTGFDKNMVWFGLVLIRSSSTLIMAVVKSWNFHFVTGLFLTVFLSFPTLPEASFRSLSFNFTNFSANNPDIFTEQDAKVSDGLIDLLHTKNQTYISGRATYAKPLHLWDKASGNLTNFTKYFSCFATSMNILFHSAGLAFFLAPNGSQIPDNVKGGGALGLVSNDSQALITEENDFVAVEFDAFSNKWDPEYEHAGINVKSMKSVSVAQWSYNKENGTKVDVWITYDSGQKLLSVRFSYLNPDNEIVFGNLSYVVDLAMFLPEWVIFGFSSSLEDSLATNTISSWQFSSDSEIIETPKSKEGSPKIDPGESPTVLRKNPGKFTGLVTGLSVVGPVSFVACFFSIWILRKKCKGEKTNISLLDVSFGEDFKVGTGPRNFAYKELVDATNNFIEDSKLGEGGFGAVYKGFLKNLNCFIAVKRISRCSKQGIKQFQSEIKIISRLGHRNLVKLIGWCQEKELLLVYEFMPNCSLDSHLFSGKTLLTWEMRYTIVTGLASALIYLHQEGDQCVLHRDIKSSNVMLDSNFTAKLGDFGLARLVDHAKGSQTTVLAGTMGYMAPECFISGKVSKESDIYSFGIVALEIACGRRAVEAGLGEEPIRIMEWVWELYGKDEILEAADMKLGGEFDEKQMERLLISGLWCVHPDRTFRPSMRQVLNLLLSFQAPLPTLPSEMPVPAFLAHTSTLPSFYGLSFFNSATKQTQNSLKPNTASGA